MKRIIILLALLVPYLTFAMNGFFPIGYGTQAKGMGGVGVALPQDSLAAANNPAGMVLLGCRYDLGLDWLLLSGNAHFEENLIDGMNRTFHSSQNAVWPELGANWMLLPCLSAGLSLYMNGAVDVDYDRPVPQYGSTDFSCSIYQYLITPSISWLINNCHSVGFALNIGSTWLRIDGLQNAAASSIHPTDVTNRGSETQWGLGFTLGWLGHFCRVMSVGVSYKSPIWTGRFAKYRGLLPDGGSLDTPHILSAGIAYFPFRCLVISGDIGYNFWRGPKLFGNRADLLHQNGSSDGPGFGWKGQFVFKVGVACDVMNCLTLRMGYNFGASPISSDDRFAPWINVKTLAVERHHITCGATYAWFCHEFSFAYVHGFEDTRRGVVPPPGNGNLRLCRSQDQVSLSYGYRF